MRRVHEVIVLIIACLFVPCPPDSLASPNEEVLNRYVEGSLIVKYSDRVRMCVHCLFKQQRSFEGNTSRGSNSLDGLHRKYGVRSADPVFRHISEEKQSSLEELRRIHIDRFEDIRRKFPTRTARTPKGAVTPELHHIYVLDLPRETDIRQAAAEFNRNPDVVYAQPNYLMEAQFIPDDPYYSSSGSWGQAYDDLWGLKGNKLNLRSVWDVSQGENVTVAVVDTGLDYTHPDIKANVWLNPGEITGNKRDDDGNGYVDDTRGWNFVRERGQRGSDPMDDNGHGTHVSGTIAAVGNNKLGIIGVAPKARIMPVKALSAQGSGSTNGLGLAINYAVANGADVINNSWSCSFCPQNPVIEDVVRAAYATGTVVVFSAGNNQVDVGVKSPQNMTDAKPIVVGASTQKDEPAFFTCFGAQVDVVAPGGGSLGSRPDVANILSLRSRRSRIDSRLTVDRQYLRLAGTSMAAPHVAGVAALMLAHNPSLTNEEVRRVIRATSKDVHKPEFDERTGAGRVDAAKALQVSSALNVKINSPKSGSNFSQDKNSILIRGTAGGTGFRRSQLFYRAIQSSDWIPLGPPRSNPSRGAVAGNWDVSQLPHGIYLLRLVATSNAGFRYDDLIEVGLDKRHRLINTHRRSVPSTEGGRPRISANRIVWEEYGTPRGVNVYDLSLNQQQLVLPDGHNPDVSDDFVVAPDLQRGGFFLYNFASQSMHQVATELRATQPRISGNHLTWTTNQTPTAWDIVRCIYDAQTENCAAHQVTSDPKTQWFPEISGNLIVWEDLRNTKRNQTQNSDIYLYDISLNAERQLTVNAAPQVQPQVDGNRIAWMDFRNGNWDIYMCTYDGATGLCPEEQVTTDPLNQISPSISGDYIVWTDFRSGNPDIFAYTISTKSLKQLTFSIKGQFLPRVSGNNTIWLEIDDEETVRIYHESLEP